MNTIEKRKAVRFPTSHPVELENGHGFARNLSTSGLCFTTNETIQLNSMLRCVILMQKKNGIIIRLRCEGLVKRKTENGGSWEIAVNFTRFEW